MKVKLHYYIFFLAYFLAFGFNGFAQEKILWSTIDKSDITDNLLERKSIVTNYKTFKLDIESLKSQLKTISNKSSYKGEIVEFPDAEGNLLKFNIKETSILHPELALKFPTIKSYVGQDIDDKSSTIHFTLNSLGLYAMVLSPSKGTMYIDPLTENRNIYMTYLKKDTDTNKNFNCLTKSESVKKTTKNSSKNANDLKLRTFRLALATTEEYSNFHVDTAGIGIGSSRNDSINAVVSAITVTMTRVNAVFERDVALTMQLVANNDQLIFLETDSGNDPYNNDDGPSMLTKNQTTIDNIIGTTNYDIGHVFSTGGGGVAFLNSPCTASKAGGVTGQSSPVGDTFDIDYVAHEMGHQYGANHTFNGTASNCSSNRNNATAVEPGSGSTIMAYTGICAPQNVQSNSDAYFHVISIQEMFDNITTGNSQCAVQTNFIINLNTPTADAGSDYTIPKSTPFTLKGTGFDADGDQITFSWEQINNEVAGISIPPSSTQTIGAVFRSFSPTLDANRSMPALSTVISGSTSTWEVIPSVSRTMDFSLTVRDNVIGEGQTVSDEMIVTVNDAAGPFIITSQSTAGISWTMNNTETITWDVAGTDTNDINVSHVNILLSIDGGLTFPIVLASNTDNDGQEEITAPNFIVPNVRVMIEAVDNIFYAVNSEPFSIGSFETTCTNYNSADIPKQIPDNNSSGITSIINVTDDFVATDVNVNIDISHAWIRDLQIYLKAPNGTEILIYDRSCGAGTVGKVNINAIFDDAAATSVCNNANPAISGTTKSDNLLSTFNNVSSQGDWTLKIVDNAAQDIGTLNNWSVELCQTNPTASIDDFSFNEFLVYPNPFKDSFTISLNANTSDDVIITLYDISGRTVVNKKFTNSNTTFKEEFNFNSLATGVYILNVRKGIAKASKKIVKY
ncbi:MAG: M12 family metallo-peptidase [Flavobacteriaceae bacterium]|nr:M12 family metallo-peptidase [Flavobacteriaceae bacterium]